MHPRDTNRITFRSVTAHDAHRLYQLDRAPGVMRFLAREPESIDQVIDATIPDQIQIALQLPGYGMYLMFLRDSDTFIGRMSLRPNSPHPGDSELGYRLLPEFWGSGYASEAAAEFTRFAFDDLDTDRVVATIMAVNQRSRAVMQRIGLVHVRTFHPEFDDPLPGTDEGEVEYALTRNEWGRDNRGG